MLNAVALQGRFVYEPELKSTPNGTPVVSTRIAVERPYTGREKPASDFIEIVAWQKTAEFIAKNFKKGMMLCLSGRLQSRSWKTKSGETRNALEVVVDNVSFCGDRKRDSYAEPPEPEYAESEEAGANEAFLF